MEHKTVIHSPADFKKNDSGKNSVTCNTMLSPPVPEMLKSGEANLNSQQRTRGERIG